MSDKNFLSKSSQYVQSLVDFIRDTKPYHSKLTEIVEEYQFSDFMSVKLDERLVIKTKISPTWSYNYFSGGNPLFRTLPVKRLVSPSFQREAYVAGEDENTDLALVPFVYSKKSFDGIGVNAVYIQRENGRIEPLTESVDFFQSHGSFEFRIERTWKAGNASTGGEPVFDPTWVPTNEDGVIAVATGVTRQLAFDTTNPSSAISRITTALNEIQTRLTQNGGHDETQAALNQIKEVIDSGAMPRSYEALINWMWEAGFWSHDELYSTSKQNPGYKKIFSDASPSLFLGLFSDIGSHQRGGSQINIDPSAPLETWNIIKVNPLAHSRAQFISQRYGRIVSASNVPGEVTILDNGIPSGSFTLRAKGDGQTFDLTSEEDPSYSAEVNVGVPFNDGRLAFTILSGSTLGFIEGDVFYFAIENPSPIIDELSLGFGYDLDPYDDDTTLYTDRPLTIDAAEIVLPAPGSSPIGFYFDGRFADFNFDLLGLTIVDPGIIHNRRWQIKATPSGSFIAAVTFNNGAYELSYADTPTADLRIHYATEFQVEFSDDDFRTTNVIGTVNVGNHFESIEYGISFTLAEPPRPYIGVSSKDGVSGGDVFTFRIVNPNPFLADAPITQSSAQLPRLLLHSDSFFNAPAGKWTLTFNSPTQYVLSAHHEGISLFTPKTINIPTIGQTSLEGLSYKGEGVHFTIVPARGLSAGDKFTFETYERKPSYLVHGSVSGWTGEAVTGEYFWNGKIGFTLRQPEPVIYNSNDELVDGESLGVTATLREDTPKEIIYSFIKLQSGNFLVQRSDVGIVGFASSTGAFKDLYLTANLTEPGSSFKIAVNSSPFDFWNGQDLVILRPAARTRLPKPGEGVFVEKTESDRLSINLVPSVKDLSALYPVAIDPRYVDHETNQETPLSATSPETKILRGWIPISLQPHDSSTSIAEFSDPATSYEVFSSATSAAIGEIKQQGVNKNSPIIFEWNETFFGNGVATEPEQSFSALRSTSSPYTITNRTVNLKGVANLNLLYDSFDDGDYGVTFDFPVNLLGQTSNTVYVTGNSVISFTSGFDEYNDIDATNPDFVNIQISARDNRGDWLYGGYENDGATYRIRFEGTTHYSAHDPQYPLIWEMTFYRDHPNRIDIDMGDAAWRSPDDIGASGVSNGSEYVLTFSNGVVNQGYTIDLTPPPPPPPPPGEEPGEEPEETVPPGFLPLNQEANLVFHSTGWNDKVRVNLSEGIKFLISGGALLEDWMFNDRLNLGVADDTLISVVASYQSEFATEINDGPFTAFMPGYDNLPFDEETAEGSYDTGIALTEHFVRAKELSHVASRTPKQERQYQEALGLINPFLEGRIEDTSLPEFLSNVRAVQGEVESTDSFGYPLIGKAIEIMEKPQQQVSAQIQESMVVGTYDRPSLHDTYGYGIEPLDEVEKHSATLYSGPPPIPAVASSATTFEAFETPLNVTSPASVFNISFSAISSAPNIAIWLPDEPAPLSVSVVEQISSNTFRFSIPSPSIAKIIVSAG